ncbi:MAG TPA: hypothetical protein VER35_00495 [Candidatus Limnocylindrales bacterium]|nr:hypothetical protein [Candidatus Limnocylindrales bacterium]
MKPNKSKLISYIWNYRHLISKIAVSDFNLKYKNYGHTEKLDGRILKNKLQINTDERRFIAHFYESNRIRYFSVTPPGSAKVI